MNITPDQAREALDNVNAAVSAVEEAVHGHSARIVLVWGIVYLFAPLAMHFWPTLGVIPQQFLLLAGIGYTIVETRRFDIISGPNSIRIGSIWFATFAFGSVWLLILAPDMFANMQANAPTVLRQMWAYGVSLAMFVYIVMGLWIGRIYIATGIVVTLLTLIGLLWVNDGYWLWCAITGGGTLLALAFWLRQKSQP